MTINPTTGLLIATANKGKIAEIRSLLGSVPTLLPLRDLNEFQDIVEVPETGVTFSENAMLKARGYARQTGQWALADDSGLEVDALDGAPGVYSARYGGEGLSYPERVQRLLDALSRSEHSDRSARFVCVIAIADPVGEILNLSTGECAGTIARVPRGTRGFGYDPVFIPDGYDQSFGELPEEIKEGISHRARALAQVRRFLLKHYPTT